MLLPTIEIFANEQAIRHDIVDIDDVDQFLALDEVDTCVLLGNAGCFY